MQASFRSRSSLAPVVSTTYEESDEFITFLITSVELNFTTSLRKLDKGKHYCIIVYSLSVIAGSWK